MYMWSIISNQNLKIYKGAMSESISIEQVFADLDDRSMDTILTLMNISHHLGKFMGLDNAYYNISLKVTDNELLNLGSLEKIKPLCTELELELEDTTDPVPYPDEIGLSKIKEHCLSMDIKSETPRIADKLVECSSKTLELTTLKLRGVRLVSQLMCLKTMTNLTRLKLADCGLTTVPEGITELPQLRSLSLKNNNLTRLPPKMAHSPVKFLTLSNNLLIDLMNLPNECVSINLKSGLGLMGLKSQVDCMQQLLFKGLRLQKLNISHNCLAVFPHANDGHILLPVLKIMCMSHNNFSVLPHFPRSMVEIDASYNPLVLVEPLPLETCTVDLRHAVAKVDILNVALAGYRPQLKILMTTVNPSDVCSRAPNLEMLNAVYDDFDHQITLPRMPHLQALHTNHIPPSLPLTCSSLRLLGASSDVKELPVTLCVCRSLQDITAPPHLRAEASEIMEMGSRNMDLGMHLQLWGWLSDTPVTFKNDGIWELVCRWSNRLISCPQFSADPRTFSKAVVTILNCVNNDANFRGMFESQVNANMGNCSDRGVTALNELYVGACLVQLPENNSEAACLLMRASVTDTLNAVISKWCSHHVSHKESTQVYLKVTQLASKVLPLLCVSTHVENEEYTTKELELPNMSEVLNSVISRAPYAWVEYLERAQMIDLGDSLAHFHEALESLDERGASKAEYDNLATKRLDVGVEVCFNMFPEARRLFENAKTQ